MITLYDKSETNFEHNGIGSIEQDIIDPKIHWIDNGVFSFEFDYPLFAKHGLEITNSSIIKARDPEQDNLFFVYKVIPSMGYIKVYCYNIFYKLAFNTINDTNIVGKNGQGALTQISGATQYPHKFQLTSDLTNIANSRVVRKNPVEILLDSNLDNSFISRWGGHIIRHGFNISMNQSYGSNKGYKIQHKKDLMGYEATIDETTVVTRIRPVGYDGLLLPEIYVDSPLINHYPEPRIQEYTYSDAKVGNGEGEFATAALAYAELRRLAKLEFSQNKIDVPQGVYKIDFVNLKETEEYKDFAPLKQILPGDIATVEHEEDGLNVTSQMVEYNWDPLLLEYIDLTLGNYEKSFTQTTNKIDKIQTDLKDINNKVELVYLSANGKNKTYTGEIEPTIDQNSTEGDMWIRKNGDKTELWFLRNLNGELQWIVEISDATQEELRAAVADAVAEIAAVTQSANDAVTKADQLIIDAGFISLDTAKIKSDALTTASTAQSAYYNAISALKKADTAISTTENFSLLVNDLEQSVTFKADSSRVDTLSGKVDSQSLLIQANADALIYKADKTSIDTINQTVNQHTNDISINAQAINARMTSTQVDSLVAAKNYVNQTQLNTTSSGLQLNITKVSTDLSNISVGGTNLLKNSKNNGNITEKYGDFNVMYGISTTTAYKDTYSFATPVLTGLEYTVSFFAKSSTASSFMNHFYSPNTTISAVGSTGSTSTGSDGGVTINVTTSWKRYWITWKQSSSGSTKAVIIGRVTNGNDVFIAGVKFESGNKDSDWSPAPEDMATLEQYTTLDVKVNGIQTTVGNKADKTEVTQLANQWTQTTNLANGHTGQIANLGTDINLRVAKADLISQINIQSNNILIQSGKLYLDAASVVFSGSAFIPSAAITSLTVDKLNGGTANFANFNAININVSSLVGNTTDFIQSNWNKSNTSLSVNAAGLTSVSGALSTTLNAGSITTVSGTKTGTVNALGMQISDSSSGWTTKLYSDGLEFQWYGVIRGITQTSEGLEIKPTTGSGARLNSALALTTGPGNDKIAYLQLANPDGGTNSRLEMNGTQLSLRHPNGGSLDIADYAYNGLNGRINAGTFKTTTSDGRGIEMAVSQIKALAGNQTIYIMPSGTGELRIGNGSANPTLWPIRASQFIQGSSRDSKTNINDYTGNALNELSQLKVVTYNRKDDLARGVDYLSLGFIAEDSPAIAVYNAGMPAGVDQYKMVSLAIKGVQELNQKVVSIDSLAIATNAIANNAMNKALQVDNEVQQMKMKISELEKEIETLKGAA